MNRDDIDCTALPDAQARAVLRDGLRRCLQAHWPCAGAPTHGAQPAVIRALWQDLADRGIAALGAEPVSGGLRELAVVMEEIGRAACPVPLLGHLIGNLVLARASAHGEPLVDARVRGRLHGGAMRMTVAFAGDHPGDHGRIALAGRQASGSLQAVDAALQATHLLLCVDEGLLVVDLGAPGVSVIGADGEPPAGHAQVRLEHALADVFALPRATLSDLRLLARLLLEARELGASRRALELAGDDGVAAALIGIDARRLAVERAAQAFDFGWPHWRDATLAATATGTGPAPSPAERRGTTARTVRGSEPARGV